MALRSYREHWSLFSSTAAASEQGKQPVSPTQTSARRQQDLCAGLAESSATRPVQKSPWSSKRAGRCLALTDSCWPDSGLLKISIFILSCSCCMCLSAVSLQCGKGIYLSVLVFFFLMLSSVSLLFHCIWTNWDSFCLLKSHFCERILSKELITKLHGG